jgi:DNA-binding protein
MRTPRNEDRYRRIPIDEITKPVNNYVVKVNQWWLVENGEALILKATGSCQCHNDKVVIESIRDERELDIVFLPIAYVPQVWW